MSTTKDKALILNRIKLHYSLSGNAALARFLEIAPQTISSWYARDTVDYDLIFAKCVNIDKNWLLTGEGEMVKGNIPYMPKEVKSVVNEPELHYAKALPLIPIDAMAGYANGDTQVMEYESEKFIVPTFRGADFLISVRGSSMYPKYNSGDIVACKRLSLDAFFQWNKVYVLDTNQGALIKRVRKAQNDDRILIVSDNIKYEPFELSRADIHALAIVMGVIRLE